MRASCNRDRPADIIQWWHQGGGRTNHPSHPRVGSNDCSAGPYGLRCRPLRVGAPHRFFSLHHFNNRPNGRQRKSASVVIQNLCLPRGGGVGRTQSSSHVAQLGAPSGLNRVALDRRWGHRRHSERSGSGRWRGGRRRRLELVEHHSGNHHQHVGVALP